MPDYRKMYFQLFRATESAISLLIAAQRESEEIYLTEREAELRVLALRGENEEFTESQKTQAICGTELQSGDSTNK